MGASGGGQSSSTTTKPLTPQEMQGYYDQAMKNVEPYVPTGVSYQAPTQQTLTEGDYQALTDAYTAPLDRQKSIDLKASDQAMADRGIYTSRNAIQNNNDVNAAYAPQYAAATGQAIQAKANELSQGNTMAMANAAATDASKWRPADFIANMWGTGKASSSNSSSSGANGGFSI